MTNITSNETICKIYILRNKINCNCLFVQRKCHRYHSKITYQMRHPTKWIEIFGFTLISLIVKRLLFFFLSFNSQCLFVYAFQCRSPCERTTNIYEYYVTLIKLIDFGGRKYLFLVIKWKAWHTSKHQTINAKSIEWKGERKVVC